MRSRDHGLSWSEANNGLTNRVIKVLTISPQRKHTIYVGAEEQFMGGHGAIFKSVDGGNNWKQITGNDFKRRVFSLAVDPGSPQVVYAGTDGGFVYMSPDGGASWRTIDGGRIAEQASRNSVYQQSIHPGSVFALAVTPGPHRSIYAATDAGIFKTEDGGESWDDSSVSLPDRRVRTLLLDPTNPRILYAGTGDLGAGGGLFRSADAGHSWSKTGIENQWVLSLGFDPRDSRRLYAGTERGVFQSSDAGLTWTSLRADATSRYVLSLAVSPDSRRLYAGTEGNGVFAMPIRH
jgi:photosystem II stability/assembly factor-like uncharacterized protein